MTEPGDRASFPIPPPRRSPSSALRWVLVFYGALTAIGVGLMAWLVDGWTAALGAPRVSVAYAVLIGAATAIAVILVTDLVLDRCEWSDRLKKSVLELLGPMTPLRAVLIGVSSAIGEEILFRGALQPVLGLWITSLLFGLLHGLGDRRMVGWTLFAIAAGVLFGGLALVTGGVLAPIVGHAVINATQLWRLSGEARESATVDVDRWA